MLDLTAFRRHRQPACAFAVVILSGTLLLGGCGSTPPSTVTVSEVVSTTPPVADQTSPAAVATHGIQWILSNGARELASAKDLIAGATIGGVATEVLAIPGTSIPWYDCLILHHQAGKWITSGIITASLAAETKDTRDLRLPMNRFATAALTTSIATGGIYSARIFMTAHQVIVVLWFAQQPTTLHGYTKFTLTPHQPAWWLHTTTSNTIVYFDAGQDVVVTGNVSLSALETLARSFPAVHSSAFPYPHP